MAFIVVVAANGDMGASGRCRSAKKKRLRRAEKSLQFFLTASHQLVHCTLKRDRVETLGLAGCGLLGGKCFKLLLFEPHVVLDSLPKND
jgi:hypothetical protein